LKEEKPVVSNKLKAAGEKLEEMLKVRAQERSDTANVQI
jgi:hypothetical protein